MDNCLFCKIAEKTIPSTAVYEDDELYAFKDIHPHAPVHLLVIPKKHFSTLSDCTPDDAPLLGKMLALAPRLAGEFGCAVSYDDQGQPVAGFKTVINSGPDGGQEVYHLHMHVIGGAHPWRNER
ncbi:UNVERIFIED_ORG: histidine triad (HIT) family protein [Zoogloea ramigera]|uniref:Histidine triad nucleotide-binding protein n=1 Tax=Duganella zoogloeoides TaxID=75659 RepID=A0ABZ0XXZ6_9BURK|nr:histidine triad nucleotide-binding protein [Duganella zoogloeoides]WQH04636.1 histidine triad nucleotide-binding protein [Duganella zoogloeoides]